MEELFMSGGPLSRLHPGYELRPGQLEMARAVGEALACDRHLAVQAGTGLGKTFAYLIPAIIHATSQKKRVLVSTRTLNLQEQVLTKDLPLLREAMSATHPFHAVVAKGRGNYVCQFKLGHLAAFDRGLFSSQEEVVALRSLQDHLGADTDCSGDREDLCGIGREVWQYVAADGESCLRRACRYFDSCYYYRARRAQATADVVVANHALFFSDLAVRRAGDYSNDKGVLEDYQAVIFDEAHNLEDIATEFLGRAIGKTRIARTLSYVCGAFREGGIAYREGLAAVHAALEELSRQSNGQAGQFFDQLAAARRLSARDIPSSEDLTTALSGFCRVLNDVPAAASEEEAAVLSLLRQSAAELLSDLRYLAACADESQAYWAESGEKDAILRCAPISVADDLSAGLFSRVSTVVMTSATLSSQLIRRLGVMDLSVLRLESPFDYRTNCLLYLPQDSEDPRSDGFDTYCADKLVALARASGGRALVLFTSYAAMNRVFDLVSRAADSEFALLRQGQISQRELISRFKSSKRPLLFAVASYWEGIDIPGADLSQVIIPRLPFGVPTEPITEARFEQIRLAQGDPFNSYSLPQAVLRLKQGFGRLIRSSHDRGVVSVLDSRLRSQRYGRRFLRELPPARIVTDMSDVQRFFAEPEAGNQVK